MEILVLLLLAVLLLFLNAFFVLAEFAIVKQRPTRIEELIDQGSVRARILKKIQDNLDEYLSVCQLGITFASIGLGFVGKPAFEHLLMPFLAWTGAKETVAATLSVSTAYVLVSFLHILLGELVPKSVAIRKPEPSSLMVARLMRFFRWFFYPALLILNGSANLILRMVGLSAKVRDVSHTEAELRILLEQSQSRGLISFRRLLLMENVFDLGVRKVRDSMKARPFVRVLRSDADWEENLATIRETRYSRFPLVDREGKKPIGIVHVKDILIDSAHRPGEVDLRKIARPYPTAREDMPVETLLADLQRRRGHMAVVVNKDGEWTGVISFEDIIEEIVGTIEDEFETEPQLFLADILTEGRIILGLQAGSMESGIREVLSRVPRGELPVPAERILKALIEREQVMSTYVGRGLAVPHARLEGLDKPLMLFARSDKGIPLAGQQDRGHLLFILLTPANAPRIQARLLARLGALMDSEFVRDRLFEAQTPSAIMEAIRAGDPVTIA